MDVTHVTGLGGVSDVPGGVPDIFAMPDDIGSLLKRGSEPSDLDDAPTKRPAILPEDSLLDGRICFPYLNHGACNRGSSCRFRHLEQDHPDAIADRVRTGHVAKLVGKLPAEKVRRGSRRAQHALPDVSLEEVPPTLVNSA